MSTTSNPFSAAQAMAAFNQMNASSPFNTQGQQLLSQGLTKKQANQQSAQAFSAAVQAANPHLDFSKRDFNNVTGRVDPYQQAEDYYRRYGTGMPQTPGGGVGVDPVTGQYRFDSPVSAPIAPQRIGNEPTEQQENSNSAAAQLGALSSANTSPTGSMFTNQSIPNFAQAPMQQAAPIPLNSSPTALARMGSTANTRQAFIAPQTAAPAQIPTLGGFGQMPNLSQMLGTASQTPMTGSAFGQAGGAFPSTPGNYGGGASGGMALEGRYGIASGNSTPFPIQGNVSVVKLAQGGDVSKARQMLQRFADGGDVSSGLKYATGEGGIGADKYYENIRNFFANTPDEAATRAAMAEYGVSEADIKRATGRPLAEMFAQASPAVSPPPSNLSEGLQYATGEGGIGADKYYENIRNFVDTQGADLNAAEVRAEMDKWGVSDKDVRDALAGTQYSAGAVHALLHPDIGAKGSPGYGVGGLEGMSANIRAKVDDLAERVQKGLALQGQAAEFFTKHLSPTGGFNEADLIRATGKTSAELLAQMRPIILPPTKPLPDLTEEFVPPTAPPPSAPPAALTPGQEGLDTGNAIVGATPVENRVARVTETAINKIPESERVKIPQLDTEFRASAPRTAIYDRFGRITGYNYSPAAKLTPATGTNVFNFVPPGITSRPRSLLNIGDVPGVTVDPVTGQMTMPLSASQRFARDRAELDNQFRRLYARAAEADTSLPTQAPATAAAEFRNFAMSDPTMSAQLRMRDIEQTPTVNPTAAMTAARSEFGAAPYAAALTAAFDPFLARNRAALLASKDMQRSYFERYPDLVAEYEKNWSKTMSPQEYAAYHYRTLGQKEGRTPPNLMGSPYTQQFFSKGGEASTEDFIKKQSGGDVSRGTSEDDGERKQNIKLDSVQSLRDFLQSMPKEPPSSQPVEPDNVLPDVALKRKGAKELESYINALNPRAQVFDVPEGYQSSYRSSPFGLKGSGLVGSVPIREPDRINVLNTLTPGQRERVLLHEAEHSMSLRGGDIEGELDSKGRPIIMDNAFRAVALLKGNELPVREFVKNVALNKDKIDAFFGEPSFGSEFKKQSYEELRKRGRELALFEEQLASLSALEQATGKFLTQDKEMRKLLFPNTEMMSIFDALTGPRQTRMDARDLPPHTPMNPMSYETGNAISRFIAEKTRKPLLRELPEAKMRVK